MSKRQQYNKVFQQELKRLNPEQRLAVEQIQGPVLVIAGPGTGKTHILSARIGQILLETDTQPYNILCLTFTEAGVRAMRSRLLEFIGPEAHRVHIYTFHAFCNSIIQDYPSLFGATNLEPISELEQVELVQHLLDELPHDHLLKVGRSNPYFYVRHLLELFQLMKKEGWTTDLVQEQIHYFLEDLPNRKAFVYQINRGKAKKGDLKTIQVEESIQRMAVLTAGVELFPVYLEKMRQAHRYDYDDMILWVLRAFEENESLLRRYQEQYLYFLVDEYQDTNGAQNQVLQLLMEYWDSPNVFIVGDDDQSIYEFQGARLKNLQDFHERYEYDLQLVMLKNNYRSSQPILDAASSLIQKNEKRLISTLQLEKKLIAKHQQFSQLDTIPKVVQYQNRISEAVHLVQCIEQAQKENFPLQEIAIIYAQHRQAEDLITLLDKKEIPYNVKRRVNILDLPIIRNIRMLLEYAAKEFEYPYSGEYLIFRLLHADFFQIDPNDLRLISKHLAYYDRSERPTWRDTIQAIVEDGSILLASLKHPEPIKAFGDFFNRLLNDYQNFSLPMLFERILNRSGLLRFVIQHEEQAWLLQVVKTFFDFIQEENNRQPQLDINGLLQTLKSMETNRLRLAINKTVIAEEGVNLVTAHSAKGLEFERVYMMDCVEDFWQARQRMGNYQFILPDTLTYSGEEDAEEARRRLFYVGMTRAKAQLQVSYAQEDKKNKPLQPALFVEELLAANDAINVTPIKVDAQQLLDAQLLLMTEVEPKVQPLDKDTVNALLEGFRLSVSSMNLYLRCPLSFFYEQVLKVPTLMSEAASYGEAMHKSLEWLYRSMSARKNNNFPALSKLLRTFEREMEKLQHQISPTAYERRMALGKANLSYYYENHLSNWSKKAKVEFSVRYAEIEGVPVKGTIDRVDFLSIAQAHIVDYKTGKVDEKKLKRPTKSNAHGGNYYRQLVFYKLLYEQFPASTHNIKTGEVIFLDPNSRGNYAQKTITINQKDTKFLRTLIRSTYNGIQAHNFYEGCGEPNCPWCQFTKAQQPMDSLADVEVESLDDGKQK